MFGRFELEAYRQSHHMRFGGHARFNRSCPTRYVLIVILFLSACYPAVAQVQVWRLSGFLLNANETIPCDSHGPAGSQAPTGRKKKRQQMEWDLGQQLAADAEQNAVMITDDFIVQYVNRLEQKIVSRSDLPGCFVVKILVDPEPNASSLPGGFIYVTTGLLALSDSEGELAAALAHETAHVTAQHMTHFLTQSRIWGHVASWTGPPGFLLRRYVGPILTFSLIRRDEFQADRLGLSYQVASGYDPEEFCTLLQKAIPQSGKGGPLFERLYNSHPATDERVKRLKSLRRRTMSPQADYLVTTGEFQEMKARFARILPSHQS
jgi:predicted Zn-dependent protease